MSLHGSHQFAKDLHHPLSAAAGCRPSASVSFQRGAGGIRRHHGRVRLRQDHAPEHPGRAGSAHRRRGDAGRPGPGRRSGRRSWLPSAGTIWASCFRTSTCWTPSPCGTTSSCRWCWRAKPYQRDAARSSEPTGRRSWASRSCWKSTPTRSPAARSSAPPWPGRSSRIRELILADEPTGALDSKATDELLRLFADDQRQGPDHR